MPTSPLMYLLLVTQLTEPFTYGTKAKKISEIIDQMNKISQ